MVWNAQELKTALVEGAERFLGDHGPPISFFDRLHPEERLLETQSPETLTAICMDTVAPLVEYDRRRNSHLRDTLRAYLETDRSLGAAATSLNMHRNTLTKRLERIEALVGLSLTADDDLVSLTLGLRAWELLERTGGR